MDEDHHLLAEWAIACAEHVLPLYEGEAGGDDGPIHALEIARAWVRGEATMKIAHQASFAANAAGRDLPEPARFAALSAGQAVAVAHVAAHDLGAAAYAIRAVQAAAGADQTEDARLRERNWQREQLPSPIRALVIDDQHQRNAICWFAFSD